MGKEFKQTFFQRRHTNGQQAHEKILNIISHQGHENQNHRRQPFIPTRIAIIKKSVIASVSEDVAKLDPSYTVDGNVKQFSPLKTIWQFLKRLNVELPHEPAIALLGIYSREMKAFAHKKQAKKQTKLVHECSQYHYSQQLKGGNNPKSIS